MFENPIVLVPYMILAAVSDVFSGLWIYAIIKKSTKEMSEYKWALLKLAICDLTLSVTWAYFVLPDERFPAPAGIVLGLAKHFGPSGGKIAICAAICSLALVMTAINDCVYTRYLFVHGKAELIEKVFSWSGLAVVVLINVVLCTMVCVCILLAFGDKQDLLRQLEGQPEFVWRRFLEYDFPNEDTVYIVFNIDRFAIVPACICSILGLCVACIGNGFTAFSTLKTIHDARNHLSRASYKLQRQMTYMLILQTLFPCVAFFGIVIVMLLYCISNEYRFVTSDVLMHFFGGSLMSYPLVSSITGFVFVRPHRNFIMSLFCRPCRSLDVDENMGSSVVPSSSLSTKSVQDKVVASTHASSKASPSP